MVVAYDTDHRKPDPRKGNICQLSPEDFPFIIQRVRTAQSQAGCLLAYDSSHELHPFTVPLRSTTGHGHLAITSPIYDGHHSESNPLANVLITFSIDIAATVHLHHTYHIRHVEVQGPSGSISDGHRCPFYHCQRHQHGSPRFMAPITGLSFNLQTAWHAL